ncbi:ZIP Zinc transporter [Colletotrichum higginsianum]|uniref:ZIP Zinc transporter n=1 Tax=Colletotrichum higginsianum (strain IMI 349063) TaxID=759273 RepID=H1VJ85_COLHI|nr:ZIP Zinc transporter [Colletotrichum higginsianum IMI 349063]OBR12479.1 ZIP Zinc transporter [Colletotrichum higginsianum IMI 349063]GJC94155.1 ZIP zinc transporter [Colletotrichum higginsianum]CCF40288.1 ZIP Zinc transporter [Colletotrichum higginsianum]
MARSWKPVFWALFLLVQLGIASSVAEKLGFAGKAVADLSLEELDEQLQQCSVVQSLTADKLSKMSDTPSLLSRAFGVLFPGSPAVNAILATLYISGPPNFLLALCPPNIDPSSLSVMVAFAVGGLMGDTLFHLLPEIFLGEDEPERARLVLVEPNRNLLLGVAILVGFMTFVAMDKGLRIATGGAGHSHDHAGHSHAEAKAEGASSGVEKAGELKSRKKKTDAVSGGDAVERTEKEINPSVKLGGYLNLIADFTHNITDGLAMSASFYASPTIGATTTVAVFFHEIPHEVGDFALLVQSGFSKKAAMGAQFVTALGALLGTLIGIAIQELGGSSGEGAMGRNAGLWGTSLTWGDMLLPFTAGTFLYVGTVAVIPELLETGPNKMAELRKTLVQFAAIAVGAGIMLYISWHD